MHAVKGRYGAGGICLIRLAGIAPLGTSPGNAIPGGRP
jgi:hypothetical protein